MKLGKGKHREILLYHLGCKFGKNTIYLKEKKKKATKRQKCEIFCFEK